MIVYSGHVKSPFQKKFWEWFDALPIEEKQGFWYYKDDAAEIYFYNKFCVQ
jgi:hypothetical protein